MQSALSLVQGMQSSLGTSGTHFDVSGEKQSAPFTGFLQQAVQQVTQLRTDADEKVRGLMTGDGTDIHTAMIATQKADLAFDLALSVRNKAVGAYQQLMSMQF
jgi:flagellar hook-basal body complex protein FliE